MTEGNSVLKGGRREKLGTREDFNKIMTDPQYLPELKRGVTPVSRYLKIGEPTYYRWLDKFNNVEGDRYGHGKVSSKESKAYKEYLKFIKELAFKEESLSKYKELYAELMGWRKKPDKGENVKVDLTTVDRQKLAREVISGLKLGLNGGVCPVCGFSETFRHEVCNDTQPEQSEDREMATLGLSA